jgi:hypothetical protein
MTSRKKLCGCKTRYATETMSGVLPPVQIIYCPTHAQAPEMLAFLGAFVASVNYHDEHDADGFVETMWDARETARAILRAVGRRAEGG